MSDNLYEKLSVKRKELQKKGLVPFWYTTGGLQLFEQKYEYETNGQSVFGQFNRIAETAAKHLKGTKFEQDAEDAFFKLLWNGWLSPSTPVLSNMGTDRGMPVSCSGTTIPDSVDGFYQNLREVAILTKNGFGTASDFSRIRPRGATISKGGKANGVVPVIREHVTVMRNVSQGTARRGAWAAYLDIEHGDFYELAEHIVAEPDNLNVGWTIKQSFIDRLNAGDAEAIARYQKALKVKMITGKGYFFFVDKANAKRPRWYKDQNLDIKNSQLCVAPETLILTNNGYEQISELENEEVSVWNGSEFSKVIVKKTGTNQKLLKVITNSGFEIQCTPYHKFYVAMRHPTSGNRWIVEKRTHELKEGDKLVKCEFPIINGTEELEYAYENGLFTAEGCYSPQGKRTYLYAEKRNIKNNLSDIYGKWTIQDNLNREYAHSDKLQEKFFIPFNGYSVKSKVNWFAGLCDGDATITKNNDAQSIQLSSINKKFLLDVQLMLQTIGVSSKVTIMHDEGLRNLPLNNGSNENGEFYCQSSYRLLIGQTGINILQNLGFLTYRLKLTNHIPNRESTQFVKIIAVIDENRYDDTYCFTEPIKGTGVFNGLLTGQCSEIMLHNSDEYTYTCQPNFATIIKKGTGLCTFKDISVGDKIWSKEGWTTVVNKVSSGIKNVNKYSTPIGSFIGTEDHRVLENNIKIEVKNAKQIDGVKVDYAKIDNILPEYVIDGLVIGDGTFRNNQTKLCVGKKDQDYYNSEISHMIEHEGYLYFRKVKINSLNIENKTYERDIDLSYFKNNTAIASFIRGIMSANGAAIKQKDGRVNLVLTASSKVLIEKIQLLMQSLGMTPRLYNQKENDYTFKNGTYKSKKIYRLAILKDDDLNYFENNIGFIQKYKNEILKNRKLSSKIANRKLIGKISNIENLGEHEVFHIEVDNDSHTYWTGGLNVSNCVLSSMNVARYDEWKDTDAVYWATIFLDCVASEFIERAKGIPGLEKAVKFTEKGRALGLGQCGLHTLFMQKMIPFESFEAHRLSQEIASNIARQSHEASSSMAKELGEPDWMKGYGLRNTHRIAIAPTKQTALIMGGVSEGINPDPAMTYTQLTAAGEIDRINPVLLEHMKAKGVYNRKNIQQIIDKQGSVQHVEWLTDEEKEVFKTAFEINQKAIIRMAAARGMFVDQWMSLNLFFAADEDPVWISEVHREAFENENILALYYIYTQAGVQASKGECEACQ